MSILSHHDMNNPPATYISDNGRIMNLAQQVVSALGDEISEPDFLVDMTALGASHQHFLLQCKKSHYMLKVFPKDPFVISHDISLQKKLYDFFAQHGVKTPQTLYGDSDCLVLPYLAGRADGWQVTQHKTADNHLAKMLAGQLARIHDSKIDFQKNFPHLCYDETLSRWHQEKKLELEKLLQDAEPITAQEAEVANAVIKKLFAALPADVVLDFAPCHGDFRCGNFLLKKNDEGQGQGLVAVLDWEMLRFGLAQEDIGWLSAPCWLYHQPQFGCGGFASLDIFLEQYVAARQVMAHKTSVDIIQRDNAWFQSLAMIRWGLILSKQWHRKERGLDLLAELPQSKPDIISIFNQATQLLC